MRTYLGRARLGITLCLALALTLVAAVTASAALPTWSFVGPGIVNAHSANVSGGLNPGGLPTTCTVQFGLTTAYGSTTGCGTFDGSRSSVLAHGFLQPLEPDTLYHFRMVATNADGTTASRDAVLRTAPSTPPIIENDGNVQALWWNDSAAQVGALVALNGAPLTACVFEYGLTTAYGSRVNCTQQPFGPTEILAFGDLVNLSPSTTYHFRLIVANDFGAGVATSRDGTFTTCALPTQVSPDCESL